MVRECVWVRLHWTEVTRGTGKSEERSCMQEEREERSATQPEF